MSGPLTDEERAALEWAAKTSEREAKYATDAADQGHYKAEQAREWAKAHIGRAGLLRTICYRMSMAAAAVEETEMLRRRLAESERTIEAQLENLIAANSHNATLMRLVRALRDVNAELDRKVSSPSGQPADGDGGQDAQNTKEG